MDILCGIVRRRGIAGQASPLPSANEVVVHIRIGDVLDRNASIFWEGNNPNKRNYYVKGFEYFSRAIEALSTLDPNIHNATIVGWAHHGDAAGREASNDEYTSKFVTFFESNGFEGASVRAICCIDVFVVEYFTAEMRVKVVIHRKMGEVSASISIHSHDVLFLFVLVT